MQLLQLFEITVQEIQGGDRTLLVVAGSEGDARRLARARGRIKSVAANHGPFAVKGSSRVIGEVEMASVA